MSAREPSLQVWMGEARLGTVYHTPGQGWRFIPHVAGRRTSRNAWPTAKAALPRYAKGAELVDPATVFKHYPREVKS